MITLIQLSSLKLASTVVQVFVKQRTKNLLYQNTNDFVGLS